MGHTLCVCLVYKKLRNQLALGVVLFSFIYFFSWVGREVWDFIFVSGRVRGGQSGGQGWGEFACTCSNFYALKLLSPVRRAHGVSAYAIITALGMQSSA